MNAVTPIQPHIPYSDMKAMAQDIAGSGLFGMKNATQVLALMAISQAEGKHPAIVARDYDIIQGRPAKKSEAMLRDFLAGGGKVEWHRMDDTTADATFSHAVGGTVRIAWDMERARKAELGGKDMWRKYPRQMLRARVVSEGVRAVGPFATSGMYVPEEVREFEPIQATPTVVDATPAPQAPTNGHEAPALEHQPEDVPTVPSGKHRGKPWAEISDDYIGWASSSPRAPEALRIGAEAEQERRAKVFAEQNQYDGDDKIPFTE